MAENKNALANFTLPDIYEPYTYMGIWYVCGLRVSIINSNFKIQNQARHKKHGASSPPLNISLKLVRGCFFFALPL